MAKTKIALLKEKCDKALQTYYRKLYKVCEVCGGKAICMHHFFPKSMSLTLRYNEENLVPICRGCHMRHHQADDPTIHMTVVKNRGEDWYNRLNKYRQKKIKESVQYYKDKLEELNG